MPAAPLAERVARLEQQVGTLRQMHSRKNKRPLVEKEAADRQEMVPNACPPEIEQEAAAIRSEIAAMEQTALLVDALLCLSSASASCSPRYPTSSQGQRRGVVEPRRRARLTAVGVGSLLGLWACRSVALGMAERAFSEWRLDRTPPGLSFSPPPPRRATHPLACGPLSPCSRRELASTLPSVRTILLIMAISSSIARTSPKAARARCTSSRAVCDASAPRRYRYARQTGQNSRTASPSSDQAVTTAWSESGMFALISSVTPSKLLSLAASPLLFVSWRSFDTSWSRAGARVASSASNSARLLPGLARVRRLCVAQGEHA